MLALTILSWSGNQHPAVNNSDVCVGPARSIGFEIFYLFYDFKPRNNQSKDNVDTAGGKYLQSTKHLWIAVMLFQLISDSKSQSETETLSS